MQLDAAQLEFLVRLGKTPDGQQLKLLLEAQVAAVNGRLRKQTGDELIREQGRALMLDELISAFQPRLAPKSMRQVLGFPEARGAEA